MLMYNNVKTTKRYGFISTLIIVISAISLFYEIISAFPFIVNFSIAVFMLLFFLIYNNKPKKLYSDLYMKYIYYMFGVPYFIFIIYIFRSINLQYTIILLFTILSIIPYICLIIVYNIKLHIKKLKNSYVFNDSFLFNNKLTEFYNQKFKNILKNVKILIYTYDGNKNSKGIYTKNFLEKHFIYIDLKIFNILDEDEKDAVILHEIGHILHKNHTKPFLFSLLIFSLIFAVSSMLYFSITINYLLVIPNIGHLIFNIIIFAILIISIIFLKYNKKIILYITELGQKKADYFVLNYIKSEYLTSALRKITNHSIYINPEYETFFEKYFGIRANNIEHVTHIIIRRYK